MLIPVQSVLSLANPSEYKLHLATWNGQVHPLDAFVRDWEEWVGWSRYRGSTNEFGRPKILALADFYPETHMWLFGGCFNVVGRTGIPGPNSYQLELDSTTEPLIGRLKIRLKRPGRIKAFNLETALDKMHVHEVLRERYSGQRFPGFDWVRLDFHQLELIIQTQRPDWKAALENMKGVYAIFDKLTGRKYVGSAHGGTGIWARWSCYIHTGHGFNDELYRLIQEVGLDYARQNFQLTLLEYYSHRTDDQVVLNRESHWKEALLSRGQFGFNRN